MPDATVSGVDDNGGITPEDQLEELAELVDGGLIDALVRQIRAYYGTLGSGDVEDAVADAVERVVRRMKKGPLEGDLRSYMFKATLNSANKAVRRAQRRAESSLDASPEGAAPAVDEEVLRGQVIQLLLAEIRSWENAHIREVTLIYLEAAVAGEPIEGEEVAELASHILGEEINPRSVSQWRARGIRKLTTFYEDFTNTKEGDNR